MDDVLGKLAFEDYNRRRGGVTPHGEKAPTWEDLSPEIQASWCASAEKFDYDRIPNVDKG